MASSATTPQPRPRSINELAKLALENIYDERRDLKHHLRLAEKYRKDGKQYTLDGDLENAFMAYARSATLVLERLPYHRDYQTLLTTTQRHNLSLNGNEILERLAELKAALLERWANEYSEEVAGGDGTRRLDEEKRSREPPRDSRGGVGRERDKRRDRGSDDNRRLIAEEIRAWEEQADERNYPGDTYEQPVRRTPRHSPNPSRSSFRPQDVHPPPVATPADIAVKRDAAFAAARLAATRNTGGSAPPNNYQPSSTDLSDIAEQTRRFQAQQEEMRLREEEILRKRARREQEEIVQRQKEADEAERLVRQTIASNNVELAVPPASGMTTPSSVQRSKSTMSNHRPSLSFSSPYIPPELTPGRVPSHFLQKTPAIQPLALENPARYEDCSTDSESVRDWSGFQRPPVIEYPRPPARSPAYLPPVTTTSPAPDARRIYYPDLMSQHQLSQGYKPSSNSMFVDSSAFVPHSMYTTRVPPAGYPSQPPPPSSVANRMQMQSSSYTLPSRSGPTVPDPNQQTPTQFQVTPSASASASSSTTTPRLRTVNLPRECLTKFLTLAKANTIVNLETCGLLLGKLKNPTKFVVTTLLIPKQQSTSDTCTMDGEELVLEFTETRGLITLGWIHTHPTQSCFMSSLDLHTHSGFQCMLAECFAVVCAPKSNPNFGIFRLTDPPGLNIILDCKAKQAFHPHPDEPIYTDADKGHVRMKEGTIEVVDLR